MWEDVSLVESPQWEHQKNENEVCSKLTTKTPEGSQ